MPRKTATVQTATLDASTLRDDIVAMALERCVHYRRRIDARERIPAGTRAELDLTVRIRGTLSKYADTKVAPQVSILCRRTVAGAARQLGIAPEKLAAALKQAAKAATKRKHWIGDDGVDLSDPHVEAIAAAEAEIVSKLAKVPRQGQLRVDAEVDEHKRSTVVTRRG